MQIFGFSGYSGSGKTTLIEKLIPIFAGEGARVSVIKHAHHGFDLDRPGKDSWRHRQAGAGEVLVASGARWALLHECLNGESAGLADHLSRLSPCDIVFVEGFKRDPIPGIEVHREGRPRLMPQAPNVVAVASDAEIKTDLPLFPLDRADLIAAFIKRYLGMTR